MTAKTPSERIQALRQRREALGLTRLELYAHPADHPDIKRYARTKAIKRQKEQGK
jgi:hypothetical protein